MKIMQRHQNQVYLGVVDPENGNSYIKTATIPQYSGKKKRVSANITYKRWRGATAALDELVLNTAEALVSQQHSGYNNDFCAETLAYKLNVRVDQIRHSLHRLNLQGKVSRPSKYHAHDTNRSPFYGGSASGWAACVYTLKKTVTG
jgi:hypothetical protein